MQQGSNPLTQWLVSLMTAEPVLQQWSLLAQQVGMAYRVHIYVTCYKFSNLVACLTTSGTIYIIQQAGREVLISSL